MRRDVSAPDSLSLLQSPALDELVSASVTMPSEAGSALLERSSQDRRAHPRFPADDLWWLRGTRLKYGPSVDVIDLSISGALVETDFRLQPGSNLVLELVGLEGPMMVPLRIVRCQVSRIVGGVRYHGACAFKRPLDLPMPVGGPEGTPVDRRHGVRVDQVLKSIVATYARRGTAVDSLRSVFNEAQEIVDYLKRLHTIATRRSPHPFDAQVADLLEDTVAALQRRDRWETAREAIEERLSRILPQLKISIVHSPPPAVSGQGESIHFALERLGALPAQFLNVEIPPHSAVEDAHFRLLKSASYLLTLLRLWDFRRLSAVKSVEVNTVDGEMEPQDANVLQFAGAQETAPRPAAPLATGWNKVVVRYLDGELIRGFSYDFHPTHQQFCVWPTIDAEPNQRRVVALAHLKAVFFVRELEGDPTYNERKSFDRPMTGRRLEVTFLDGEVLVGSTMNYQPHGPGFFLLPADPGSNNIRTFVVSGSTRHVRFL
ncbi:MAG: PilZ domain-containing protein [Acidobacteria bacterium]|nr:MAG: PilZ domain-containing protein [Acidobacteriota bacterium]